MPKEMSDDAFIDSVTKIKSALELEASFSMKKAAKEKYHAIGIPEDQVAECKAIFDGTWPKRGYSSLQAAVTTISAVTGKCLDYEALNKVCFGCSRWQKKSGGPEKDNWKANHKGKINFVCSAPALEPEGVSRIFVCSVETRKLQYTGYIGDGDSESFSSIKASKPYVKIECVGHVQKRKGTAPSES
eukprot:gene5715-10967_t